jgi:hypothetical protein
MPADVVEQFALRTALVTVWPITERKSGVSEGVEIWSGGVNTWECDEMGHLNVRFWGAKGLEALAGLARLMGMPSAFHTQSGSMRRVVS